MKTEIYNLIILDESGSMSVVKSQTISGCNETINSIRSSQEKFAETQDHFVSIYAFQDNEKIPSRYLIKNQPATEAAHINGEQYRPWGTTPLYDAVGSTLADLKAVVKEKEMAVGNVTIITDGMENASKYYSLEKVAEMIKELKEEGWNFNFIGADIDVERTADSLNIGNRIMFERDDIGTKAMFRKENNSRLSYNRRVSNVMEELDEEMPAGIWERKAMFMKRMKEASKSYFDNTKEEKEIKDEE